MSQMQDDEIDLIELFQTIWDGKWVITAISAISGVGTLLVILLMPPPNFVATTEIKPLLPNQAAVYQAFNNTEVFAIYGDEAMLDREVERDRDRDRDGDRNRERDIVLSAVPFAGLHERYINILARRQSFRDGFKKFAVLERDKYDSDADYNIAIARLAASIEILPPSNESSNGRGDNTIHWTIRFGYNNQDTWLNVLDYTTRAVNEAVQAAIKDQFKNLLNAEKSKNNYEIEDLKTARENLIATYEQEKNIRIAFLKEQAVIARELGIAKYEASEPKLIHRTFGSLNNVVTGDREVISEVQSVLPFYLRGYIAIEKELSILNSRKTIEPFVENLLDIDRKINALKNDKKLERAEQLFAQTPVSMDRGFIASSVSVEETQFEYNSNSRLMLALALVLGGMFGTLYVLIVSAMRNRKESQKGV